MKPGLPRTAARALDVDPFLEPSIACQPTGPIAPCSATAGCGAQCDRVDPGAFPALRQTNRHRLRYAVHYRTVRTWLAAIVVVGMLSGCLQSRNAFACTDDASCGVGGRCEPGFNLCSFSDSRCPSGRAFGGLGGANSGQCVGDQPPPDGHLPDGPPPDAQLFCYGSSIVRVCFDAPPSGPLMIAASATTLDTGTGLSSGTQLICATPVSGGTGYCVIYATDITIGAKLRATGSKPLVLIASRTIMTTAQIDVGSHRGQTPETGAGADPAVCMTMAGTAPTNGGGGAGGSFLGFGGAGGNGNGAPSGGGVPGPTSGAATTLRGGCPGRDGAAANSGDQGRMGHGGGVVFLIAGTMMNIQGGINAAGEGGMPGVANSAGGGGGGAGGMIGFDAPTVSANSLLLANGGGGAEGSGTANAPGAPGNDPTTIAAAAGGSGNSGTGGDGGNGSFGFAAAAGSPGNPGAAGGGGGGGGSGLIKAPAGASLGTNVSPAPTP